ncbi:hypothetical protein FIBSPDRAFT_902155 [Athelia psychrophila]|uniref:Uncharacterized protein n=1 Tax=Athelia psychrophila TaxID=1759441 RepID=A0A167XKJ4_9AGAM|nr:hypothetical protein FIBSPDRAFT_902155 [Fibularhizoctonia sp. CBS 109695]
MPSSSCAILDKPTCSPIQIDRGITMLKSERTASASLPTTSYLIGAHWARDRHITSGRAGWCSEKSGIQFQLGRGAPVIGIAFSALLAYGWKEHRQQEQIGGDGEARNCLSAHAMERNRAHSAMSRVHNTRGKLVVILAPASIVIGMVEQWAREGASDSGRHQVVEWGRRDSDSDSMPMCNGSPDCTEAICSVRWLLKAALYIRAERVVPPGAPFTP